MALQSGRSAADSESACDAERTVTLAWPAFGGWNVQLGGLRSSVGYVSHGTSSQSASTP